MNNLLITGAMVHTQSGAIGRSLYICDGIINAIDERPNHVEKQLNFPENYHVIPGMIDLHIHGAGGADVMDATPEALSTISQTLAREGTTGFLATTMTESKENILAALSNIRLYGASVLGAEILGVHLEGPFLSQRRMGAQCGEHICAPDIKLFQAWQEQAGYQIRIVTVAPESENALPFIKYLAQNQVLAALGHSDANFAEACAGIEAGGHYATHLFNAMRGIHHREPGIAVALLLDKRVSAELVVDGKHLHPAMVQLALKMKGREHLILVTDAMRAKCLGDGQFDLGGQAVNVKNGLATLENGTIAGSVLKLNDALKNFLQQTGLSISEALPLVSENPAKLLGIFKSKGSILKGKDADVVVLNEHFEVMATIIRGRIIYSV